MSAPPASSGGSWWNLFAPLTFMVQTSVEQTDQWSEQETHELAVQTARKTMQQRFPEFFVDATKPLEKCMEDLRSAGFADEDVLKFPVYLQQIVDMQLSKHEEERQAAEQQQCASPAMPKLASDFPGVLEMVYYVLKRRNRPITCLFALHKMDWFAAIFDNPYNIRSVVLSTPGVLDHWRLYYGVDGRHGHMNVLVELKAYDSNHALFRKFEAEIEAANLAHPLNEGDHAIIPLVAMNEIVDDNVLKHMRKLLLPLPLPAVLTSIMLHPQAFTKYNLPFSNSQHYVLDLFNEIKPYVSREDAQVIERLANERRNAMAAATHFS